MIQLTPDTLRSKTLSYNDLSMAQRIILNNCGSLTKLMEVILDEELELNKLYEEHTTTSFKIPELALEKGKSILSRKITLQGAITSSNWIYAESTIAIDNLDDEFADALFKTNTPIGKIWELLKVETYKKLVSWGDESAGMTGQYFNLLPYEKLLYRTYQVFSKNLPIMLITEKFPAQWFANEEIIRIREYHLA